MINVGNTPKNESMDYGVRYQVFQGKDGRVVTKEKFFKDQKSLENFIEKESEKDNFYKILSTTSPQNESVDPFKGLKATPMTDREWDKVRGSGKYVTDGRGNVYKVPTKGYSQEIKVSKDIRARYNFSENTIEMLLGKDVFGSEGLKPTEWFDNPEYWADKLYDMYREDIKMALKHMKESEDTEEVNESKGDQYYLVSGELKDKSFHGYIFKASSEKAAYERMKDKFRTHPRVAAVANKFIPQFLRDDRYELLDEGVENPITGRAYKMTNESVNTSNLKKGDWVVVNIAPRLMDKCNLVAVKIETVKSKYSIVGWAWAERLHEYSTGAIKYIAKSEDDAEKFIKANKSKTVAELRESSEEINEARKMAEFEFKCKKCGHVFKDTYDYPLPKDCNAAARCPKCKGTAYITDKKKFKLVNESLDLDTLKNATFSSSFMNDRASLVIDGRHYAKIGKDKWEHIPMNPHAFGGTYTSAQMLELIKKSKKHELRESVEDNIYTKPIRYKGYKIILDRKGEFLNILDKYGELEDHGFKSIKDAKKCIDGLVKNESADAYGLKTGGAAKSASNSASINENGSRYNLYKTRIIKAISKKDVETLKKTKEAIMYAPASALKNSQAAELIDMIKKALSE